jgi:hypothetical protein
MNNQLLDDQSVDGLCDSIINLKPKGSLEQPYWAPFEKINSLKNASNTNFAYPFGISSITDAFWQVRNYIGEYAESPTGSLKRLLVLCQNNSRKCIDIIEPTAWTVVKTQALPQTGTYTWSCTRLDEVTIISINRDKKPFLMYYLIDDAFIPSGWPDIAKITFSTFAETIDAGEVTAGNSKGVMKEGTDQWFMATWAFRLYEGTFVKHNAPILVKVDAGATNESVQPRFTLEGYSAAETLLIDQPFWRSLISGISVFCTIPRNDEQDALDDGAFFEVGRWSWIDRLPESEWPTATDPNILLIEKKSDAWPTGRNLNIDNFTHHRYSARAIDTFNKRLLLGGSSVDFALPKIPTNAIQGTIPGGVYTDYMTYDSGLATFTDALYAASGNVVGSPDDPDYAYDINSREYDGSFTPKAGREFKTVTIEATSPATGSNNPPGGGSDLPNATFSAAIVAGKLVFGIDTAETNFGTGGMFPAFSPWIDLKVTIGPVGSPADETIFFRISPAGNSAPFFNFSNISLLADDTETGPKIYHIVTIKTEAGTYKRILTGDIAAIETTVTLPELIWYPDRRAIKYELVVQNGATFELALSKNLIAHPESNYAYVYLSNLEATYTIGDSEILVSQPDLALNQIQQYIPNRIQSSQSGTPFLFEITTYRVGNRENDTVLGFGINLNPTSEGQAGQYPVYAFTDKSVWALEQTGDPEIAFGRISPVSNFNGINNPYAITNAQNLIIATDNKYIYALAGLESTRIDEEIANDPDYEDYLKQVRIGYHRAKDYEEVIFSNPFYDYSLCYNLKYKVWYKATERFKFFFYDYPDLMGLTVDNVLKDFSSKDEQSPVAWELTTRVIQYQQPYVFKRLFPSFVRMTVKQPLQENEDDYLPVRLQLKGYRDDKQLIYTLYDQSIKSDVVYDPRIYNQFGSMYAYRMILSGTSNHKGGNIAWIDSDMEFRYQETRRRHNCSAQYLYTMEGTSISICNCTDGGGTDAYFAFTGTAVSNVVVTHGLNKIPSVFVTDMDGFLIECGVQLIFNEGQPSLTQLRLTFDDPIPFKAYFN